MMDQVLGMGCGTVVDFKQNFGRGASHHEIEFEVPMSTFSPMPQGLPDLIAL
jgi:hypothetical protein